MIGDAQVELGRYDDAFATFQTMVDTRPGLSSYARVSYARELQGDVPGAIQAMPAARDMRPGRPSDSAWASYQLGELYFNSGDWTERRGAIAEGTELAPEYVPPLAGLAKVAWARGRRAASDRALHRRRRSATRSPEYVIALGDLYAAAGQPEQAEQQYALVHARSSCSRPTA